MLSGKLYESEKFYPEKRLQENRCISEEKESCYIVEGQTSAGIFLQQGLEILLRNSISGYTVKPYPDFASALEELVGNYPDLEAVGTLRLDRLYFTQERAYYTVVLFGYGGLITCDEDQARLLIHVAGRDGNLDFVHAGLSYAEAQKLVKETFCEMFRNPYLTIPFDLPVETCFTYSDVLQAIAGEERPEWTGMYNMLNK